MCHMLSRVARDSLLSRLHAQSPMPVAICSACWLPQYAYASSRPRRIMWNVYQGAHTVGYVASDSSAMNCVSGYADRYPTWLGPDDVEVPANTVASLPCPDES